MEIFTVDDPGIEFYTNPYQNGGQQKLLIFIAKQPWFVTLPKYFVAKFSSY